MRRPIAILLFGLLPACDQPSELIVGQTSPESVVGLWVGQEDITTAEDPGAGQTLATQGFSFPIALHLQADGRFNLTTTNFPARFDSDVARICTGTYVRQSRTIQFFADRACRALPLSRFTVGRTLPRGLNLDASTANLTHSTGTIRVRIRVDRE